MSETTERFIHLFEKLKTEINRRGQRQQSERFELEDAARCDQSVSKHFRKLKYIRDVRNALQHPQHDTPQRAFEVSAGFLAEVEQLLTYLVNPPTAASVMVRRRDIFVAESAHTIGHLANVIQTRGFSHLPILDERQAVVGVFNEAAVFAHLRKEDVSLIAQDMTVTEVIDSCGLDARHTETFVFVRPTMTQDELVEIFVSLTSATTRVGAVFVTASGKRHEPLQGLITPWDVLAKIAS